MQIQLHAWKYLQSVRFVFVPPSSKEAKSKIGFGVTMAALQSVPFYLALLRTRLSLSTVTEVNFGPRPKK